MSNNNQANSAKSFSIQQIVENKSTQGLFFEIPPYQRLYEWEKEHIETLLEDVKKACINVQGELQNKIYFIGNVVVSEENGRYILIDGQQRLTTLFLIGIYLASEGCKDWEGFVKNGKQIRISMPLRESEEKWLSDFIGKQNKDFKDLSKKNPNIHHKITKGLETIAEWFEKNISKEEGVDKHKPKLASFAQCLYGNNETGVRFALVELAEGTDLNQFFVRMNNRGKQLEKHEILKSRLLDIIRGGEGGSGEWQKYAKIWDLCSDMDKYLFALEEDRKIFCKEKDSQGNPFGENNGKPIRKTLQDIQGRKIYEIAKEFKKIDNLCIAENSNSDLTLADIIEKSKPQKNEEKSKDAIYRSIIDFPTFLLHIFKLFALENSQSFNVPIKKDDLLKTMWENDEVEDFWKKGSNTKDFIQQLLLYRFAFDYFVIKQKASDSSYVIDWNYIKGGNSGRILFQGNELTNDDLKSLVMIQNYLRVARAGERQNYHHWLTYMLKKAYEFLFAFDNKQRINIETFIISDKSITKQLECLDTVLAYTQIGWKLEGSNGKDDILLSTTEQYLKNEKSIEWSREGKKDFDDWASKNLNQGTETPHYWFYRLEYYLWKWKDGLEKYAKEIKVDIFKNNVNNYRFRGLNSIEHIQPQSKADEWENNENCKIDDFGNLALISQSLNSSLSNQDMEKKWIDIRDNKDVESLKMCLAYASVEGEYQNWNPITAKKHQTAMLKILKASLESKGQK
ncbi:DUF262 domain-containing protein [uncultured Helicobacter sp.]|uniref:DUF262 domain-containing protein n=1 Tax=uncultured Helicobacter sp. TaxID=175537 RepID=UPI0026233136|nr:DUF262 domain-containing protein [uncultured Helicobacter sp.]